MTAGISVTFTRVISLVRIRGNHRCPHTNHFGDCFLKMDSRPMVHLRNFHSNRVMRKVAEAAASIQSLPKFPARHYSTQTGCTRSNWSATPRKPRVSRGRSLTRSPWVPRSIPEFPVPSQLSLSNWKFIRAEGIDTQRTQRERPMRELQIGRNSDGKLS